MRFVDEVRIEVQAGHGGKGCVSFRREKFIPKGGPNGGDGGRGGDVIVRATYGKQTLLDLYYRKRLIAQNGRDGMGSNMHGRDGKDVVIEVPVGTVIKDEAGEVLADLDRPGACFVLAKGGRGGLGNSHFASSTNQAPRFAQPGEEGESGFRILELKSMADVGLVGLPNAGKSTLLARISNARPRVADYPFSTLVPALGTVRMPDEDGFVVADIPGLIAGAHEGKGLGDRFLRHIERTRLLLHLVDAACINGRTISEQVEEVENELGSYGQNLLGKPRLLALNKIDAITSSRLAEARREGEGLGLPVWCISAVSGQGVEALLFAVYGRLQEMKEGLVH